MSVFFPTSSEPVGPRRFHLVRHGDVDNPLHLNYGRLDGFGLSTRGLVSAQKAAVYLAGLDRRTDLVIASPLQRAVETAEVVAPYLRAAMHTDLRLIEPWSVFEGRRSSWAWGNPRVLRSVRSHGGQWGEPAAAVVTRLLEAVREGVGRSSSDIVLVTHQRPIWLLRRCAAAASLTYHPWLARCAPGSVTTFDLSDAAVHEVAYWQPAPVTPGGRARGSRRGTRR